MPGSAHLQDHEHGHDHVHPAGPSAGPSRDEQVDALLARLRATGGRVTAARRAVLEVLVAAGAEHLSAEEIAGRVHASAPQVHLSTVYRTLDALEEAGVLRRARLADGPVSYHLAADEHHHAVCDGCGAVIVLPSSLLAAVVDSLAVDHGFRAEPRHVTIGGLCRTCASTASNAAAQSGGGSDTRRR